MSIRTFVTAVALGCLVLATGVSAQTGSPGPASSEADAQAVLDALSKKIGTRIQAGHRTADALVAELDELRALRAKHAAEPSIAAPLAIMEASLFLHVFGDDDTGQRLLREAAKTYQGTKHGAIAERLLFQMSPEGRAQAAAERKEREAQYASLIGKPAPELHFTWASRESLEKLSDLKGKVVVLDFWATWCGPCISSFPQVRNEVEFFRGSPVVFVGVTSLQGRVMNLEPEPIDTANDPQREYELMAAFMKKHNMTWEVAFSRENVFNPDYAIRGIPYVAIVAPDGTLRHAGLHPGSPASDLRGKISALLAEFDLLQPTKP